MGAQRRSYTQYRKQGGLPLNGSSDDAAVDGLDEKNSIPYGVAVDQTRVVVISAMFSAVCLHERVNAR